MIMSERNLLGQSASGPSGSPPRSNTGGKQTFDPETGLTGGDLPPIGIAVGIDWLRVIVPAKYHKRLCAWIGDRFGHEGAARKGRYFFDCAWEWAGGPVLLWNATKPGQEAADVDESICLDMSGTALAGIDADARVPMLRELTERFEARATRIDGAVDFVGQGLALVDHARESCHAGELCRAKRFREIKDQSAETVKGATIYLGLRGKLGSGRMVRVYDKGLESGAAVEGVWERWEAEFTGEVAEKTARALCRARNWSDDCFHFATEAMEFRQQMGSVTALARRPLVEWYARMIGLIRDLRMKATRTLPTLASYSRWIAKAVYPTIGAMSRNVGMSLEALLDELCGQFTAPKKTSPVVAEFERHRRQVALC